MPPLSGRTFFATRLYATRIAASSESRLKSVVTPYADASDSSTVTNARFNREMVNKVWWQASLGLNRLASQELTLKQGMGILHIGVQKVSFKNGFEEC